MKRGFVLIALLMLTAISAGCGSGDVDAVEAARATRERANSKAENSELVVGDQAVTNESGNILTVFFLRVSHTLRGLKPDPGFEFLAIDAEVCNGPS